MDCLGQKTALLLRIAFLVSAAGLLFSCEPKKKAVSVAANNRLPYYNSPDFTPLFMTSRGEALQRITHSISGFTFTDQDGNSISEKNVEGKIHVADFFFTSCGSICPRMTQNMKRISEAFLSDPKVMLLSYSVTPWIDSVQRLNEYAKTNNISSKNWHLLTGNKAKIYELARKSYFAEEEPGFTKDSTEFLHTEHFLLVDGDKKIRGIYNGTLATEIDQLIADIRELEAE